MSTNVGSVNVTVTGNVAPLQQSLAQATTQSNTFASKVGDKLKGFATNVGSALQVYAVTSVVALGAAMVATAAKAFSFAGEVNGALKTVQAQTGASAAEMLDLKESMLDVYSSGFAANMEEAAQTMSLVKRVTGETGDALTETTNDALAFSKAFGADVTETIRATDAVMTGFGVSGEKAMDLMAYAIQRTGDPAGDLLGTFTEYGPLMEQIGLSAEQFTAGLIGGLEQGAFDSDKLGDAMKEFGISLMNPIEDVAPRMAEALAAGGDAGAQAWLDMQDEIQAASEDVDAHKETLDAAKEQWEQTNDKVKEYQGELDKAWGKLQQLLNPEWDLTEFTDQLDQIEGQKIEAQLSLQPVEEQYEAAKKALDNQLKSIDDSIESQRDKIKAQQKKLREAESDEQKAAIQANIDALNEELDALSNSKSNLRDAFDNGAAKQAYEAQKEQLDLYDQEAEKVNLLMKQAQRKADAENRANIEAQGFDVAKLQGLKSTAEQYDEVIAATQEYSQAQQNLGQVSIEEGAAKQQLDQAQAAYDQATNYLKNLEVQSESMPNPGEQLALDFQAGGERASAAMSKMADSIIKAREDMSDIDFKAYLRTIGLGTMAEELSAEAFMGFWKGVANPGDIAAEAAGTVNDMADQMKDRWAAVWANMDKIFQPFGEKLQIAFSRVLPVVERLVQYAGLKLPAVLEKIGNAVDSATDKIMPLIERIGIGLIQSLTPKLEWLAGWIASELPKWATWIYENTDAIAWWVSMLTEVGAVLGAGGIVGGALAWLVSTGMALWAALAPAVAFLTGGTLTASLTALGATITATFGTLALPLLLAGAAVAAFALAWSTNFGGVRDITLSVMTAISAFIADRLAFMVQWWTKYGADVMVVVNGFLTVIQTVFGAILLFITTAAEGYRLLWAKFGDDILNLITVAFGNIALVVQAQFSIIGEIFGIFADLMKGNWSGIWEHFKNIANIQGEMVKGIVNNILSIFGTSIDGIVNYFAELPGRIAAYFSPEALIKIATDAMQAFSDTITAMMPSLPDPGDLMGGLPSLSGAMSSAQGLVSGTAANLTGAIPSPTSNSFNQSLSFNQPGASADEIARAVRKQTVDILRQAMG